MLYSTKYLKASAEPVSLHSVSRSNKTKAERAVIAAAILDNGLAICGLTTAQLAILFGTTASAINKRRARRRNGRTQPTLADRFLRASPAERLEAARAIGIDTVWDSMIAPALT
jgi:hypothetical protein